MLALRKEGNYAANGGSFRVGLYDGFLALIGNELTFKNSDIKGNDINTKILELMKCRDDYDEFCKKFKELTGRNYSPKLIEKFQKATEKYEQYVRIGKIYNMLTEAQEEIKKPKPSSGDMITAPGGTFKHDYTHYKPSEQANILLTAISKVTGKTIEDIKKEFGTDNDNELIKKGLEKIEELKQGLNYDKEQENILKEEYENAKSVAIGKNELSEHMDKMIALHTKIDTAADIAITIAASLASGGLSNAFLGSTICANMTVAQAKTLMFAIKQIPNASLTLKQIIDDAGTTDGITKEDWQNIIKQTAIRGIFNTIGSQTGKISEYLQKANWTTFGAKVTEFAIDAAICTTVDYMLNLQDGTLSKTFVDEFTQNIRSMILGLVSGKLQSKLIGKSRSEQTKIVYAALEDASLLGRNCNMQVKDYIEKVFKPKMQAELYKQKIIAENEQAPNYKQIKIDKNASTELPKDGSWMVYQGHHTKQQNMANNNCVIDVLLKSDLDNKILIRKNGSKIEIMINEKIVKINPKDIEGYNEINGKFDYKQQQQAIEIAIRF